LTQYSVIASYDQTDAQTDRQRAIAYSALHNMLHIRRAVKTYEHSQKQRTVTDNQWWRNVNNMGSQNAWAGTEEVSRGVGSFP